MSLRDWQTACILIVLALSADVLSAAVIATQLTLIRLVIATRHSDRIRLILILPKLLMLVWIALGESSWILALRMWLPLPPYPIFCDQRIACRFYVRNELRMLHRGVSKPRVMSPARASSDSISFKSCEVPDLAIPFSAHPSRSSPVTFIPFSLILI